MLLKCAVIDDEQYAIDALVNYIDKMPNLVLHESFIDSIDALNAIKAEDQLDFIFLDIEMPNINGLALAKTLRDKTRYLIFTTGHDGHAITAFDLKADHYLLKPISFSKFALTIAEILDAEDSTTKNKNPSKIQFIKADQKNAYHYVDLEAITYIEAAKNYVIIHTTNPNEQFVTHMGLNHVETAIDSAYFIRISKSYIIAKSAIKKIEGHIIRLKDGKELQLGDVYKPAFVAFINEYSLKAGMK